MSPEESDIQWLKITIAVVFATYFVIWSIVVALLLNKIAYGG